ncbi:hypothetical protein LCGC14_1303820 [marine sediment metagenome]|uniref:Uncharacterized protein n=1 Tax=marine sediment metagenome TaxID=412755 RepID=A0A0F9KQ11_9ZZZZ
MDADEAVQAIEKMEAAAMDLIEENYYTIDRLLENLRDALESIVG